MSKFARDPYVVAWSGRRDPFGRRGRRVGALALYLDVSRVGATRDSAAWAFVDAAFREAAMRELPPSSKSRRSANIRMGEQRRRCHRALYLRYVLGLPLREVGRRLREPVTTERCRQIIAKGLRILRHPSRFAAFRASVARELDETTNPFPRDGVRFCDAESGDGRLCCEPAGHETMHDWHLALPAPGSTGREALEARGERVQPDAPAIEPGVEGTKSRPMSADGDRCTRPAPGQRIRDCGLTLPCPYHDAKEVR